MLERKTELRHSTDFKVSFRYTLQLRYNGNLFVRYTWLMPQRMTIDKINASKTKEETIELLTNRERLITLKSLMSRTIFVRDTPSMHDFLHHYPELPPTRGRIHKLHSNLLLESAKLDNIGLDVNSCRAVLKAIEKKLKEEIK